MSGIDEFGAQPMRGSAVVLLSGGMDSTACLHWTLAKYREVCAIGFAYGQSNRDNELVTAAKLAKRLSVPYEMVALADALHSGILAAVPEHDPSHTGLSRAFVPGRNLVFLSLALARGIRRWPEAWELDLVIGACLEDASGFPDCTNRFMSAADKALSAAVDRKIHVAAPFVRMTKAQMLADCASRVPSSIADIEESWSCYRGDGPCGACTACVLRAQAFAAAGLTDRCAPASMTGGDVAREARLKG